MRQGENPHRRLRDTLRVFFELRLAFHELPAIYYSCQCAEIKVALSSVTHLGDSGTNQIKASWMTGNAPCNSDGILQLQVDLSGNLYMRRRSQSMSEMGEVRDVQV